MLHYSMSQKVIVRFLPKAGQRLWLDKPLIPNHRRIGLKDFFTLGSMLAPAILFPAVLFWVYRVDPRFKWLRDLHAY
jgi:hypothetical protein